MKNHLAQELTAATEKLTEAIDRYLVVLGGVQRENQGDIGIRRPSRLNLNDQKSLSSRDFK